jgi:hypothetical protein
MNDYRTSEYFRPVAAGRLERGDLIQDGRSQGYVQSVKDGILCYLDTFDLIHRLKLTQGTCILKAFIRPALKCEILERLLLRSQVRIDMRRKGSSC